MALWDLGRQRANSQLTIGQLANSQLAVVSRQ
jgi:hypothetical protein